MKYALINYEILLYFTGKLIEKTAGLKYTEPIRFLAAVHLWKRYQYLVAWNAAYRKGKQLLERLV